MDKFNLNGRICFCRFVIVNQALPETHISVVMYWIFAKHLLVAQELGAITLEVPLNVYVHLVRSEIRIKRVATRQSNVKSMKTALLQHIAFKPMAFLNAKIIARKLNVGRTLNVERPRTTDPVYAIQDIKETRMI